MSSFVSRVSLASTGSRFCLTFSSWLVGYLAVLPSVGADEPLARFDAPAVLPFVTRMDRVDSEVSVDPRNAMRPLPGERWVDIQIPVTHWLLDSNRALLDEVEYQVVEASGRARVVDFAPRAAMASDLAGNIAVERRDESNFNSHVEFAATGYAAAQVSGNANATRTRSETERYERLAPMRQVVSSGTTQQGRGVLLRLRPAPQQPLEGAFTISITLAVPEQCETLLFRVIGQSVGMVDGGFGAPDRRELLARETLWIAAFEAESYEARQSAEAYARASFDLRRSAFEAQRAERSTHSPLAQVRELFSSEKSELPRGWLEHLLTPGSGSSYRNYAQRLPENVRNSANAYLAQRQQFLEFTSPDRVANHSSSIR